jgi:hypothetical protein
VARGVLGGLVLFVTIDLSRRSAFLLFYLPCAHDDDLTNRFKFDNDKQSTEESSRDINT